jgi:hypothetical protein
VRENGGERGIFLDEVWLTPLQIARGFGYATDKPVRKAIMRGELKATHSPCRRKLLVAESEVMRWIDRTLAFEPGLVTSEQSAPPRDASARQSRRFGTPRLSYDASRRPSA